MITDKFNKARQAGVPLVAINSTDPQVTVRLCSCGPDVEPRISWDCLNGMIGLNPTGQAAVKEITAKGDPNALMNPAAMLKTLFGLFQREQGLPIWFEDAVIFAHNFHKFIETPTVLQGVQNLRDNFKAHGCTLVMLTSGFKTPPELQFDIVTFDEVPLSETELAAIVDDCYAAAIDHWAGVPKPSADLRTKSIQALRGLNAFAAETSSAYAMNEQGIDLFELRAGARKKISETPGLSVYADGATFDGIKGCNNVKATLKRIVNGKNQPNCFVFIDEIEKDLAGVAGDTSGTSQDQMKVMLSEMQNRNWPGMLFIGPPGAAKSELAKAVGNESERMTIALDFGALKDKHVGASEARIRAAIEVIAAVSNNKAFFIATCNSIGALPPELLRRFKRGTYFFDLPTKEEREAIWAYYIEKFNLEKQQVDLGTFDEEGWTGAEIRNCCESAWEESITLSRASKNIVPVCKSAADKIDALRKMADGKFASASEEGTYTSRKAVSAPQPQKRKFGGLSEAQ